MIKNIAVDESLENIQSTLKDEGYNVLKAADYKSADAVIVTGLNNNVMDMQSTSTKAPVIETTGKSEQQILKELKNFL
ncbi:MAG: YkuS family protein [Clostridiales bacterium]|nr:YkuS family protein [Clostridiales bacterium]MCF8022484.1 YkuS family protein [Clostridiales bacterium]